ncbi:kelch-like protein 35 [Gracilinanus agilis]|uniref:kelch-like protein 35 n=1 Tax=Gracilinanus agilis TaxID=191870 RepID=UPI001CFD6DB2|nr:kelch-like protein 35 [Gracilinanus agilis]
MPESPPNKEAEPRSDRPSPAEPYVSSDHAQHVLQTLRVYQLSGTLTDVVLRAGDRDFPCHRAALSAGSTYFRALFAGGGPQEDVVPLPQASPGVLGLLLDHLYGAGVSLLEEDAAALLALSDLLGVIPLREACANFLEGRLGPENCLAFLSLAQTFSLPSLAEESHRVVCQAFSEVSFQPEFLELELAQVAELLADDSLVVAREETVFEAAMRWVRHDPLARHRQLPCLLEQVRLPLLAPAYFLEKVEANEMIRANRECHPLLLEARQCFILGREGSSWRATPRRFMDLTEVIMVVGGCDRTGLLTLPFAGAYHPWSRQWKSLPSVPGCTKSEFAMCTMKNDVYLSGGHIHSRDLWMFRSQLQTWVRAASLHEGRWRHKMAVVQGRLYAVGGFDGVRRLGSVECYDPFSNTWAPVAPLLEAVSSAAVVPCSNKLYVIGGAVDDSSNTDKVQCFDPGEDKWSLLSPAPFNQRCIEAVALDDIIYVVGGLLSKIFSYNPARDLWAEAASLPGPLESCGVTICSRRIYVLGGRDSRGESTDKTFAFDPFSGRLEDQQPLQRCTSAHGCVTILQHLGQGQTDPKGQDRPS